MQIRRRLIGLITFAMSAFCLHAASIVAYVEPPTVQSTSVSGVSTEGFDSLGAGIVTSGFSSTIGLYEGSPSTPFSIVAADQYGGAGGTGNYFAVGAESNSDAPVALLLNNQANYFGFWWSAGDPNNSITFAENGVALATFTTANLVNLLPNSPSGTVTAINGSIYNTVNYYGNPNSLLDTTEAFAYVDVIATGLLFNEIIFSNPNSTGFESDNHSVATGVTGPPLADVIVQDVPLTADATPEPGTWMMLVLGIGTIGISKKWRR